MADTVTEKLSDERLRECLSLLDGMKDEQLARSPPSFIKAIITELLSRRSATAEPVAGEAILPCSVSFLSTLREAGNDQT